MKYILFVIPFATLLMLATSCKKEAGVVPEERPFSREFFVEGVLRDYDNTDKPFGITVGTPEEEQYVNFYTNFSVNSVDVYKKTEPGFYGANSSQPHIAFEFSQEIPALPGATKIWEKAELETYFTPGKVFKTDGTPGNARIRYLVNIPGFIYLEVYALSDGSSDNDQLTITAVEDYSYQLVNIFNENITLSGKKVSCTFSTSVKRPLKFVDGQMEYASARIENGKATFFVRAQ